MIRRAAVLAVAFLATASLQAKPYLEPLNVAGVPATENEKENILGVAFHYLSVPLERGPLFFLPMLDRSKDLGLIVGLMPIWAMRNKSGESIQSVLAPSIDYNRYLKTTLTWRQYFFPDANRLWVLRGSYSQETQREVFLHYYDPEFLKTRYRLNAEFHYLRNPKPSFYGFGNASPLEQEAGYSDDKIGEEFTWDVPMLGYLFFDVTHSFYQERVDATPITTKSQLSDVFPDQAGGAWRKYMYHGVGLVFDSTDHASLPQRGTYVRLSADVSNRWLVSDQTYTLYGLNVKKYVNVDNGRFVSAFHLQFQQLTGDQVPFYVMPVVGESTGLRVVGEGRYVDRGKLVMAFEERCRVSRSPFLRFFSEIELTPFVDMGEVFADPKYITSNLLHVGYGASFRLVLRPQVVGTVDLAFGREGPNSLIKVGYPF